MWGMFHKVGRFIAKSGWYFKVNQLLQCGQCTMFKLLIFKTLFLFMRTRGHFLLDETSK